MANNETDNLLKKIVELNQQMVELISVQASLDKRILENMANNMEAITLIARQLEIILKDVDYISRSV